MPDEHLARPERVPVDALSRRLNSPPGARVMQISDHALMLVLRADLRIGPAVNESEVGYRDSRRAFSDLGNRAPEATRQSQRPGNRSNHGPSSAG